MEYTNIVDDFKQCSITSTESSQDVVLESTIDKELLSKWPKLNKGVPDILLHKTIDFAQHVKEILKLNIKIYQPYLGTNYTKICSFSVTDYKALRQYFDTHELPYHTFALPSKKMIKVIIKGLPKETQLKELLKKLRSAQIPVKRVHKMKTIEFAKDQDPLVLALVPHNENGLKLLRVKKIFGHDVTIEPPIKKTRQCYKCQKWGHAQRYCRGITKCVKCAGDHYTKDCTRDPNANNNNEPPTCANCGGNHTASYRECFYCPDSEEYQQNRLKKLKNKGEQTRSPRQLVSWDNVDNDLYKQITNIPKHAEAIPF